MLCRLSKIDELVDWKHVIHYKLDQKIFEEINREIEDRGLLVKKGMIVDAVITKPAAIRAKKQ